MVTKKEILKWLEQFDNEQEIDYTVMLAADVHLLDMDTGKSYPEE